MAVSIARFNCQGRPLTVLDLPDRRAAAQRHVRFLFLSDLEKVLYGGSTGAIYRLLQRESMERSVLPLKKASVGEGLVTQSEFDAILEAYRETVENVETRGRVRMCSLVRAPRGRTRPACAPSPSLVTHTHTLSRPPNPRACCRCRCPSPSRAPRATAARRRRSPSSSASPRRCLASGSCSPSRRGTPRRAK